MISETRNLSKREIALLRAQGMVRYGGHRKNKIYGTLDCKGAKQWISKGYYVGQRVFFSSEAEAIKFGYRPCARCMPNEYKEWKKGQNL